jgi:hypothetical protein
MALVAFAGTDDEAETKNYKQINAYDKFMAGRDTAQIAASYRIKERTALRWINLERCRRGGLASPYEARS